MTQATPDSSTDIFRPESCPQCEYSLTGLAEEGVCPECGCAYDRSAIILRCRGWWPQYNAYVVAAAGALSVLMLALMAIHPPAIALMLAQMYVLLAFCASMSLVTLIDRYTSPRVGEWLLWITPAGVGIKQDFDSDSFLAKIRRAIVTVFFPLYFSSGFVPLMATRQLRYLGAISTIILFIVFSYIWKVARPKPTIPPQASRPALFSWNAVTQTTITGPKRGRYNVVVRRSTQLSGRNAVIFVTVAGSEMMIDQMRKRIAQWSSNKIQE